MDAAADGEEVAGDGGGVEEGVKSDNNTNSSPTSTPDSEKENQKKKNNQNKNRLRNSKIPRDPQGRLLESLDDLQMGEEVWMHVAPTREELERFGLVGAYLSLCTYMCVLEIGERGREGRRWEGNEV